MFRYRKMMNSKWQRDSRKFLAEKSRTQIILIEEGAPYHGSNVVKDFKSANVTRLTIERLPAFSPDYNPIEKLWKKIPNAIRRT